jgi:hypothetical protein
LARVKESASEEYGYIGRYSIDICIFPVASVLKIDNSVETAVKLWLSKQDTAVNGQQIENFSYSMTGDSAFTGTIHKNTVGHKWHNDALLI